MQAPSRPRPEDFGLKPVGGGGRPRPEDFGLTPEGSGARESVEIHGEEWRGNPEQRAQYQKTGGAPEAAGLERITRPDVAGDAAIFHPSLKIPNLQMRETSGADLGKLTLQAGGMMAGIPGGVPGMALGGAGGGALAEILDEYAQGRQGVREPGAETNYLEKAGTGAIEGGVNALTGVGMGGARNLALKHALKAGVRPGIARAGAFTAEGLVGAVPSALHGDPDALQHGFLAAGIGRGVEKGTGQIAKGINQLRGRAPIPPAGIVPPGFGSRGPAKEAPQTRYEPGEEALLKKLEAGTPDPRPRVGGKLHPGGETRLVKGPLPRTPEGMAGPDGRPGASLDPVEDPTMGGRFAGLDSRALAEVARAKGAHGEAVRDFQKLERPTSVGEEYRALKAEGPANWLERGTFHDEGFQPAVGGGAPIRGEGAELVVKAAGKGGKEYSTAKADIDEVPKGETGFYVYAREPGGEWQIVKDAGRHGSEAAAMGALRETIGVPRGTLSRRPKAPDEVRLDKLNKAADDRVAEGLRGMEHTRPWEVPKGKDAWKGQAKVEEIMGKPLSVLPQVKKQDAIPTIAGGNRQTLPPRPGNPLDEPVPGSDPKWAAKQAAQKAGKVLKPKGKKPPTAKEATKAFTEKVGKAEPKVEIGKSFTKHDETYQEVLVHDPRGTKRYEVALTGKYGRGLESPEAVKADALEQHARHLADLPQSRDKSAVREMPDDPPAAPEKAGPEPSMKGWSDDVEAARSAGRERYKDLTPEQRDAALKDVVRDSEKGNLEQKAFARGWLDELHANQVRLREAGTPEPWTYDKAAASVKKLKGFHKKPKAAKAPEPEPAPAAAKPVAAPTTPPDKKVEDLRRLLKGGSKKPPPPPPTAESAATPEPELPQPPKDTGGSFPKDPGEIDFTRGHVGGLRGARYLRKVALDNPLPGHKQVEIDSPSDVRKKIDSFGEGIFTVFTLKNAARGSKHGTHLKMDLTAKEPSDFPGWKRPGSKAAENEKHNLFRAFKVDKYGDYLKNPDGTYAYRAVHADEMVALHSPGGAEKVQYIPSEKFIAEVEAMAAKGARKPPWWEAVGEKPGGKPDAPPASKFPRDPGPRYTAPKPEAPKPEPYRAPDEFDPPVRSQQRRPWEQKPFVGPLPAEAPRATVRAGPPAGRGKLRGALDKGGDVMNTVATWKLFGMKPGAAVGAGVAAKLLKKGAKWRQRSWSDIEDRAARPKAPRKRGDPYAASRAFLIGARKRKKAAAR